MHHSYNSVGNIGEQGGRSMVGWHVVGCNDGDADVNDFDENYDVGDREKHNDCQSHTKSFMI